MIKSEGVWMNGKLVPYENVMVYFLPLFLYRLDKAHYLYYASPNMKSIFAPAPRSRRPLQTLGLAIGAA
jgi:hypothetical protein